MFHRMKDVPRRLSVLALLPLIMSIGASPASAEPDDPTVRAPENVWISTPFRLTFKGDGYSDRRKNSELWGEHLYTSSTTEPGLYFRCLNGALRAGVVFEAQDMQAAFSSLTISGLRGSGSFIPMSTQLDSIGARFDGGKMEALGRWLSFEDDTVFLSRDRKPTAKLYNAILRGHSIEIFVNRKNATRLSIPPINDAFRDFGADCGAGRNRER